MKMGKKTIMIILIFLACCLGLSLAIILNSHLTLKEQYNIQLEKERRMEETVQWLQEEEIQEFISHVKQVMQGEIVYEEGSSLLSFYSYESYMKESFPTMHTSEVELEVIEVNVDGDRAKMKVSYEIRYLDIEGNPQRLTGRSVEFPAIWMIERQDESWDIVEIIDPPYPTEEYMKELDKDIKEM